MCHTNGKNLATVCKVQNKNRNSGNTSKSLIYIFPLSHSPFFVPSYHPSPPFLPLVSLVYSPITSSPSTSPSQQRQHSFIPFHLTQSTRSSRGLFHIYGKLGFPQDASHHDTSPSRLPLLQQWISVGFGNC